MMFRRHEECNVASQCVSGPPPRSVYQEMCSYLAGLFFVSRDAHLQSEDHLVSIAQRDPFAAARFIQSVSFFGICGNIAIGVSCSLFLIYHWTHCGYCDRPLRWWLLLHVLFQMSQLPVRAVLLLSVRSAQSGHAIEASVRAITASPAWGVNKSMSYVMYAWLVLGMVWCAHVGICPTCPGIKTLTMSVMFFCVARALVGLALYRTYFVEQRVAPAVPKVVPASHETIAALPLVRFSQSVCGDLNSACAICLSSYCDGDVLTELPCCHVFHSRCIGRWLLRNQRCPLCMRAVDQPPLWGAGSDRRR